MRPAESFVGQPVRSLQTMLRVIAEDEGTLPSLIPDGIYGSDTMNAVAAFQRRMGLPITGVTDQQTWDAIVPMYEQSLIRIGPAQPLYIILEPGQVIRKNEANKNLFVVQGILMALSETYDSISAPGMSGVLDLPTANSLSDFQSLNRLPVTGELDRDTWRHLALHFPSAAILPK